MAADAMTAEPVDLLVTGAELVATVDDDRRELAGGWVGDRATGWSPRRRAGDRAPPTPAGRCAPTAAW